MPKSIYTSTNWTSGELSPLSLGRFDLAKYNNGAKIIENGLINQLGGIFYRPGTRFVIETKDSSKLSRVLPFQYSTQQYYVVEAGDQYMRFYTASAALTLTSGTTVDYFEYATDGAARTAYPTNTTYASKYPTAHNGTYVKSTSNEGTCDPFYATDPAKSLTGGRGSNSWLSASGSATNQRFHIDLGATKVITKVYYENAHDSGVETDTGAKTFTFWGSNSATAFAELTYATDTNWTQLTASATTLDQHSAADSADPKYLTITNATGYRYYAFKFADNWGDGTYMGLRRVELQETDLQDYSESTIKNQGSYSLKGLALITASLNKTLTRTIGSPLDLSNIDTLKFDIYSSRTGSNIKLGIHDSGGTTTETTPNITGAGAWQTVTWDISGVSNANKDAIDSIIITIVNADAENTFYIDNLYPIQVEISTPYLEAELFDLKYAQNADTMYIVHRLHCPYKLQRTSATTFTLTAVPLVRPPLLDDNITAGTITPSAATGTGITLTASADTFLATNVGGWFKVHSAIVKITAFTSTKIVTGDVQAEADGTAGNIGGTSAYTDWAESAWSDRRGWPSAISFHDQRLYYANTLHEPQKFWGSELNAYDSFDVGTTADDNSVAFEIATEQVNAIKWLSSSNKQMDMGTAGGTFPADGGTSIITPTNINVSRSTTIGAAAISPARMSAYLYYIQRNLNQVRELVYDFNTDNQKPNDMCILADHILRDGDGAVEMAHQQSPHDRLWVIRNDGQLAVLTRNVDQEVMGWSRLIGGATVLGNGLFESIAIIQQDSGDDQIWVIVNRLMNDGTVKRFVEYFMPESFVDDWDPVRVDCSLSLDNPKDITAATKANPVVITCASHGFSDGDQIKIDNVEGMTQLNGNSYLVSYVNANSFHLHTLAGNNVDGSAYSTYISGGEARKMVTAISGLGHLEGELVSVQTDGGLPSTETYTVSSGAITLSAKAAVVHVGLPYVGTFQMLKMGDGNPLGTGQTSNRRIYKTTLRVDKSLGTKIGKDINSLSEVFDVTDTSLVTGDRSPLIESGWSRGDEVLIIQNKPLPLNILCLIIASEVEVD